MTKNFIAAFLWQKFLQQNCLRQHLKKEKAKNPYQTLAGPCSIFSGTTTKKAGKKQNCSGLLSQPVLEH